jgi:uncharacterized protein GlcG (DUF336 family)
MLHRSIACALLGALPLAVNAQSPAATAPAAAVVNGEELSLALANAWADATFAACKANGYNITAAYMTNDLQLKLLVRGDGVGARTLDIARRKAYTTLKTGKTSGEFGASVAPPAGAPVPAPAAGALPGQVPGDNVDTNLIIWAGGLPVMHKGKVIGAVSVSGAPGGDKDEACAKAGLDAIAGRLAGN